MIQILLFFIKTIKHALKTNIENLCLSLRIAEIQQAD